jgi:hypothetical protein
LAPFSQQPSLASATQQADLLSQQARFRSQQVAFAATAVAATAFAAQHDLAVAATCFMLQQVLTSTFLVVWAA